MEQAITRIANQKNFQIDSFIDFLLKEKSEGATHLKFEVTNDPIWKYEWIETFKIKSDNEIIADKIKTLEQEIDTLKSYRNKQ